jgi:hypothetical protein
MDELTTTKFGYSSSFYPTFWYKPSAHELGYFTRRIKQFRRTFYAALRTRDFDPNEVFFWELGAMTVAEVCIFLTKRYFETKMRCNKKNKTKPNTSHKNKEQNKTQLTKSKTKHNSQRKSETKYNAKEKQIRVNEANQTTNKKI